MNANLGELIDLSEQIREKPEEARLGIKPKMKVYPSTPLGAKGPMGITTKGQDTTKEREEFVKG
ncbi:MAG: hypothetical protein AAB441_02195 [Patescibacteria group bacterium]